jgi:hypothetical protein
LFQEVDGMKLAFADKLLRDGPATQSISPRSVKLS